jgi:large subunit ribosomal protein L25
MEAVKIDAVLRNDLSKQATTAIRKSGHVPGVIYGGKDPIHVTLSAKALKTLVFTPLFKTAEINVNGQTITCIIQDTQFNRLNESISHIDFLELVGDKKVVVELPLKFVGVAIGVKAGGKLIPRIRKLKVKSTPSALQSQLEVNVEALELGKHIRVKDVSFNGIEIITAPNNPICSAFVTRQLKQEEAAAAKAATPAKGAAAPAAKAAAPAAKK